MRDLTPSQPTPPRSPTARQPGEAEIRADIAKRLLAVCDHMTPEAFDALVQDICAMKARWRSRGRSYQD
jgi:hypothetical protein